MSRPLLDLAPLLGAGSPAMERTRPGRLRSFTTPFALVSLSLLGLGCTGSVADGGGRGPGPDKPGITGGNGSGNTGNGGGGSNQGGGAPPPSPTMVPPTALPSDDATVPGPAPLRRLTRLEYQNTIRDLLGVAEIPAARLASLAADQDSGGSGFVRGGTVTAAPDARVLMLAAEELTATALAKVQSLLPCNPIPTAAAAQDECADKFVAGFGRRAYRRPLTDAEVADLKALYRAQRGPDIGAAFPQAVANVVSAMLQSPYFLYRWELGPGPATKDGKLVRFNSHEMASRLSYLFWATMPDDKLFEAADQNKLSTPDQIAEQARRLLYDPKARDALTDFHLQWLGMDGISDMPKDPSLTDWTPAVAQSVVKETREFVASVFQGPKADGKFETLLTSTASFADGNLSKLYGLKGASGPGMEPVQFDSSQRAGLFTQATFLATKADAIEPHPIKRGDAVLAKLLCIHLEIPADLMVPPLPEPKPGQTTRERVSMHSEAACASCHKMIDPVGFAFENYDAIGKFRTTDEGKQVDASGSFALGNATITFKNALEMMPQLAKSPEARDCMATMWWRYVHRRQEQQGEDPSLKLAREAFKLSNYDLRELLVAITRTKAFSHRMPAADEVLQ